MGVGRQKKVDDRQRKGRHEMGTMRWGQETGDEVQETGERVREKGEKEEEGKGNGKRKEEE